MALRRFVPNRGLVAAAWLLAAAGLLAARPAPAAAQSDAAEVSIRDTLPLHTGDAEALGVLVTVRDARRVLVRSPRLTYTPLDTAVVEVWADTVFGRAPGVGRVVVSAVGARRPVADTVAIVVADPDSGDGRGYVRMGARVAPEARLLLRLPSHDVLAPEPAPVRLLPGESQRVQPFVRRLSDSAVVGRLRVTWESATPAVATVTPEGVVTAVAPGAGVVRALRPDGAPVPVVVQVDTASFRFAAPRLALAVGDARGLQIAVPAQGGRVLAPAAVRWSSSDTTIARVAADGTVRGVAPGTARIVASGPRQADTLALVVHPPVATLRYTIAPRDTTTVALGARERFGVTPLASDGTPVPGVPIVWRVADSAVAAVDSLGTLTARALGATRLVATVDEHETVWPVRVVPGRVALDRTRLVLRPGERTTLALAVVDDSGRASFRLTPAWRSSDSTVAAVHEGGVVAGRPGRALVTATAAGGRTDSALVLVAGDLLVVAALDGEAPRLYQGSSARPGELAPVALDVDSVFRAAYSPDGTRLALLAARHDTVGLFVADADGGPPLQRYVRGLTPQVGLAWLPDGKRVLYTIPTRDSTTLYAEDLDAFRWTTLGSVPGVATPAVARDGRVIVAATRRDASTFYLMSAGGGAPTPVPGGASRSAGDPRWSADGLVLYTDDGGSGDARYRVVRLNPATGARQVLATSPAPITALAAGRGGVVAWTVAPRDRSAPPMLVVRDADGTMHQAPLPPGQRVLMLSF